MNAYIFITFDICTVHGANLYVYNKATYLEKNGWTVYIFSGVKGEAKLSGLNSFQNVQRECFRFYPSCFSSKEIAKIESEIFNLISPKKYDQVVIESTCMVGSLWGEALAEKLYCRHLCYILQEQFKYSPAEKLFLKFKLHRKELAGITRQSVGMMVGEPELPLDETMAIRAFCNNAVEDVDATEYLKLINEQADVTIGSIGRLNKPYVLPMCKELHSIFRKNESRQFNLVLIGGARKANDLRAIRRIFRHDNNVRLVITGFLSPIPRELVKGCDVFVSAAGSSVVSYYEGVPTVRLNPLTASPSAIIGLTCSVKDLQLYSNMSTISELYSFIEKAIIDKEKTEFTSLVDGKNYEERMKCEFDRHIKILNENKLSMQYYDTYSIHYENKRYRLYEYLGKILGLNFLGKVVSFLQSIR